MWRLLLAIECVCCAAAALTFDGTAMAQTAVVPQSSKNEKAATRPVSSLFDETVLRDNVADICDHARQCEGVERYRLLSDWVLGDGIRMTIDANPQAEGFDALQQVL